MSGAYVRFPSATQPGPCMAWAMQKSAVGQTVTSYVKHLPHAKVISARPSSLLPSWGYQANWFFGNWDPGSYYYYYSSAHYSVFLSQFERLLNGISSLAAVLEPHVEILIVQGRYATCRIFRIDYLAFCADVNEANISANAAHLSCLWCCAWTQQIAPVTAVKSLLLFLRLHRPPYNVYQI